MKSHHYNLLFFVFCFVFILVYYYCYVFPMFQTNYIITQDQINFLYNTKENWWVLFGSMSCQIMELLRPKRGILWKFVFSSSLFLIIWCHPVYENHKHVQGWNPTTTTSFPGRHNNNRNYNIEKPKTIRGGNKRDCGGVIPILNMFMIFMNRKIIH